VIKHHEAHDTITEEEEIMLDQLGYRSKSAQNIHSGDKDKIISNLSSARQTKETIRID